MTKRIIADINIHCTCYIMELYMHIKNNIYFVHVDFMNVGIFYFSLSIRVLRTQV
jgi:hypothetical protein